MHHGVKELMHEIDEKIPFLKVRIIVKCATFLSIIFFNVTAIQLNFLFTQYRIIECLEIKHWIYVRYLKKACGQ